MNPNLRRYGIMLIVLLLGVSFSIFELFMYGYFIDGVGNELLHVVLSFWILSFGFWLFFGASLLEKDKRKLKGVKFLKISAILLISTPFFPEVYILLYNLNVMPVVDIFTYFFFILSFFFNVYGIGILIAISLILIGLGNRDYFGNYLISGGILYVVMEIINYYVLYLEPWADVFIIALKLNMTSIYALYFFFFSIRTKNNYLLLWSISNFVLEYIKLILKIDLLRFLGYLTYLIPLILGLIISLKFFELGKGLRKGMRVFISHSVADFKKYRVEEIANFLESQNGIGRVFYCETHLVGNIDEWMHKFVPRSNLLLFISSENSVVSPDCNTELALAKSNKLQVIPVLGFGLAWEDLEDLNLNREFGTVFDPMEFENFCAKLYEHIIKHKEAVQTVIPPVKKKRTLRINKIV